MSTLVKTFEAAPLVAKEQPAPLLQEVRPMISGLPQGHCIKPTL